MRGLVARIGAEWLLVPVTAVREVMDAPRATALPVRVPGLLGVTSVRGAVLPLWRGDALLGIPGDPRPPACIRLVVDRAHLGLLVDHLGGLVDLPDERGPGDAWWGVGTVPLPQAGAATSATVLDAEAVLARASAGVGL